jgi:arabinogalactan oligomer/maltooligosaccharide transport system permease protein
MRQHRHSTLAGTKTQTTRSLTLTWRQRRYIGMGIRYVIAAILIVFAFIPVVWVVSASINPSGSLVSPEVIPRHPGTENYEELLNNPYYPFTTWLFNSLYIATISTLLIVLVTAFSAYAISRFRFFGRDQLMRAILIINVFPGVVSMIALFSMMQQTGRHVALIGLDSHLSLILVYVSGAMGINVLLMKGFFDSIPREIDESAMVDGASHWLVFWRIIIPLVKPILVTVGVLAFMTIYGDFVLPRVLLSSADKLTIMVGLYLFQSADYAQNWGVFTAGAIVAALPVIALYLLLQDYIISGLTAGSIKG